MLSIEYVAGLFDGEGWLTAQASRGAGLARVPACGITMTYGPIVQALREQFGGSVSAQPRPPNKTPHCWRLRGKSAQRFIALIEPYLIVRKADAAVVLAVKPRPTGRQKGPRNVW